MSAVISNEDPIVKFLGGVHRLNNNSYTDYYFSCSGNGVNIQWQINDVSVNLTAREVYQDASVYTGAEFQCLAFLLSSTSSNENFQFYSILLVSAASDGTNFEVNCSTNSHTSNSTKITSNDSDNPLVSSMDEQVLLQCLFKQNILRNTPTYFYICGVNNDDFIAWQTTGTPESYDIQDRIGKRGRVTDKNNTGIEVAYLIGFNKPYRLVSIFLVTGSNINVTCGSNVGGTDILCKESEAITTTESPRVTEMTTTTSQDTTSATPQSEFSSTTTGTLCVQIIVYTLSDNYR